MSEQAEQVNDAAVANAAPSRELTPIEKLAAQYEKKGVVLCLSGTTPDNFIAFAETFEENALLDWSEGVKYETPTYFLVKSENDENRLVALPGKEVAMSDAVIRSKAYDWYIGKAILAAKKDDAGAALFKTPAGFFLGFDLEAFKFQEDTWVNWFKEKKGVKNINPRALRLSLSSAAYAKTRFPAASQDLWEKLIGAMADRASKSGQNTAIFDHWLGTREVTEIDMTKLETTDEELASVGMATAPAVAASVEMATAPAVAA